MVSEQAIYSHGHHESVVKSHARRTAQNSAAFLIPHIKSTDLILDVGCGPGTITVDFAKIASQGKVTGLDASSDVIEQAKQLATSRGLQNIAFEATDANTLPFPDASFDIVFCHQVLQHVKQPVAILKEMKRVTKPGGIVAAREADYKAFAWYPETEGLSKWGDLYQKVALTNGGQPNAGRHMHVWAKQAGFKLEDLTLSWDAWTYYGDEAAWWGNSWAERTINSDFAKTAMAAGLATQANLREIHEAYKEWAKHEDAFFSISSGEMLCRVPGSQP
ncbi:MAG: putative secondary metabolism biosynthetic enzyme [Bathelium mastoideum]|nr:MAG: putative secondary metabolism biosynthetic enzyme [Bathelium mastoideum]KAI9694045.1 MAG: putative secondary metabolism biosynthetic enzyme [Bathelium mastoideum]